MFDSFNEGWNRFGIGGSRRLWQYKSGIKAVLGIIFLQAIPFSIWFSIVVSVFNKLGENIGDTRACYLVYYQHYILGSGLAWVYTHYKWLKVVGGEKKKIAKVNNRMLAPLLAALVLCVGFKCFVIDLTLIISESMNPNLIEGDRVLVVKPKRKFSRGDVIFFNLPGKPMTKLVKRVGGLPEEEIDIMGGKVYINGEPAPYPDVMQKIHYFRPRNFKSQKIPKDSLFVLGDNSFGSVDSRMWGGIPLKNVMGKVVLIYWPLERVGRVE